jgi:hypothetical protein
MGQQNPPVELKKQVFPLSPHLFNTTPLEAAAELLQTGKVYRPLITDYRSRIFLSANQRGQLPPDDLYFRQFRHSLTPRL